MYTLSNALQNLWRSLGQFTVTIATGGTDLTAIDTVLGSDKYDDDFCVGGAIVCVRDAAGLGASPEGRFAQITAYDQTNNVFTFTPSMVDAIAVGDKFGWASALFPLYDMIEIINQALKDLGDVPVPDVSLTAQAGISEYTLPAAITSKPLSVEEFDGLEYHQIPKFEVIGGAIGSQWTLRIPVNNFNNTLRIVYLAPHPDLTVYNSEISPYVGRPLVDAAALAWAIQWFNKRISGGNDFWLKSEKIAWDDYERAKSEHHIYYPRISAGRSINLAR